MEYGAKGGIAFIMRELDTNDKLFFRNGTRIGGKILFIRKRNTGWAKTIIAWLVQQSTGDEETNNERSRLFAAKLNNCSWKKYEINHHFVCFVSRFILKYSCLFLLNALYIYKTAALKWYLAFNHYENIYAMPYSKKQSESFHIFTQFIYLFSPRSGNL